MPTRIVLDVPDKRPSLVSARSVPSRLADRDKNLLLTQKGNSIHRGGGSANNRKTNETRVFPPIRNTSKRIFSFRSSIFRDGEGEQEQQRGLSTSDIRASPRLIGYIYQLLASTVLLISVVKFYRNSEAKRFIDIDTQLLKENFGAEIFSSVAGPVYLWKLIGSAAVGSVGAGVNLIIVVAHFDTVCLPQVWVTIFRDGSRWEQTLLRLMLIFWSLGLHVCTSSLSVGEVQGNVFFTTWIAFAASVLNYGVWRTSAGLPSLAEKVSTHHRETTYNWLWFLLCMSIFAGAATDIYFNREELDLKFGQNQTDLSDRDWRIVLIIIWSFLALGLMSVVLNHYSSPESLKIGPSSLRKQRIVLGWRQCEGLIILLMVGVFFFLLFVHSGVDGVVNGLTNSYFSLWGAFFNSVFLLGTWLRENKKKQQDLAEEMVGQEPRAGVTFREH